MIYSSPQVLLTSWESNKQGSLFPVPPPSSSKSPLPSFFWSSLLPLSLFRGQWLPERCRSICDPDMPVMWTSLWVNGYKLEPYKYSWEHSAPDGVNRGGFPTLRDRERKYDTPCT